MDIGRTTMIAITAVAAITVARRIGRTQARMEAEMDRVNDCAQLLLQGQQELRRELHELRAGHSEMQVAQEHMEKQLGEALALGDDILSLGRGQLRVLAGAAEAAHEHRPEAGRVHNLRCISQPGV